MHSMEAACIQCRVQVRLLGPLAILDFGNVLVGNGLIQRDGHESLFKYIHILPYQYIT